MWLDVVQLIVFGVVFGSILSLGAIGISMTYNILSFANFSHGDLMTVGAYFAFLFFTVLHLPFVLAFVCALAGTIVVVLIVDRAVYRRLRKSSSLILMISSFGIALILRSLVQIFGGPDSHMYDARIHIAHRYWGIRILPEQIMILLAAIGLVTLLYIFLQKTKLGKAMRAMSDNPDLAQLSGINTERVIMYTWIIGAILAASAGIFLGLDTRVYPEMGWDILLPVFAASVLGGIGRPYGAILGGMTIGILQELSTLIINPSYKPAVAFVMMVIILIVRPQGLLKGRS